ncbi:putative sporulation-specific glycosylase [Gottschalkia purinilytica]|uniref:Putative sporulation-specific glycosylase n=1 Tax=Gottschalkia purinilytica TaxID=1503 RepID=A0A0L0WEJ3_GOTPU|nr:S-layer homology domain-containing protein [Gottschalkia purinilytica]KNF09898.1 putative sporulation-specific glycosylase [Gottschalkia purinilytica]
MSKRLISSKLIFIIMFTYLCLIINIGFKDNISVASSDEKLSMTYLYGGNSASYISNIERTNGSLNMVSPNYFNLNSDGSLKLTGVDTYFIKTMHNKGIKVMPFISNHWDRTLGRAALNNRDVLSNQIVQAIKEYDLDGINIDIENLTEEDRDAHTDLVRIIRNKLPRDKEISVAVGSNPRGFTTGWHGSYDYKNLAYHSNYLIIMTYDEGYEGAPPSPVSSYSFVENSIKYALNNGVSSNKIVVTLPFYGRYWNSSESRGGYAVALETVDKLIKKYNASVIYDENKKSPVAKFSITPQSPEAIVGGKKLSIGDYILWFENNDSLKAKLSLVSKYNLKGAGSWRLGQENPDIWNYYKVWLNNSYFKDIIGHWANKEIVYVIERNWMNGISSTQFLPDSSLTRAQAATILVRAKGLENYVVRNQVQFKDVSKTHWAYNYIQIARENGLVSGFENNTFAPDMPVTREQVASMISRITKYKSSYIKNPFVDVNSKMWSYDAIMNMTELGVLKGFEGGYFKPYEKTTRAQIAAIMYRLSKDLNQI